ncbi:MAG TPA: hypothetical protein VMG39_01485 [Pseudolabrys sp.]|nr:hypothetical protein [Pseudolabrys sp.]
MLIEFEKIEGVRHWERELDRRGLTALIQAQFNVLKEYPKDFERLATKGYPITSLYAEKPSGMSRTTRQNYLTCGGHKSATLP